MPRADRREQAFPRRLRRPRRSSRRRSRGSSATATGAEIAIEVADAHQGRGFGSVLGRELAADARAAGITELVGTVCGDNPSMVSILRRIGQSLDVTWSGGEREFVVALQA